MRVREVRLDARPRESTRFCHRLSPFGVHNGRCGESHRLAEYRGLHWRNRPGDDPGRFPRSLSIVANAVTAGSSPAEAILSRTKIAENSSLKIFRKPNARQYSYQIQAPPKSAESELADVSNKVRETIELHPIVCLRVKIVILHCEVA